MGNPIGLLYYLTYGGANGELGTALRYLTQRYTIPDEVSKGLLTGIGTEEFGLLEGSVHVFTSASKICTIIYQKGHK